MLSFCFFSHVCASFRHFCGLEGDYHDWKDPRLHDATQKVTSYKRPMPHARDGPRRVLAEQVAPEINPCTATACKGLPCCSPRLGNDLAAPTDIQSPKYGSPVHWYPFRLNTSRKLHVITSVSFSESIHQSVNLTCLRQPRLGHFAQEFQDISTGAGRRG